MTVIFSLARGQKPQSFAEGRAAEHGTRWGSLPSCCSATP